MTELEKLFEQQAAWQKSLQHLPWHEKIRMAEAMRETIAQFRKPKPGSRSRDETEPQSR
jgi:hypothetical protein